MASAQTSQVFRGIVKQVISGDCIVIRDRPRGGPPPERTVCLSNVTAPRLARRANPNLENSAETRDEPCAWEAREYLRKLLIGKEVAFTIEYKAPGANREYGCIYLGKDTSSDNVTELIVSEGLVEVRRSSINQNNESQTRLIALEDSAKASGKGKWGPDGAEHVRDVKWAIENPRHFVDSHHGKPVTAVIEHVRDACTVRAFILPTFHYVTVMISGIKGPMFKIEADKTIPDPFAEEAKYYTESRLLQRDVQLVLESVSNQNLLGSILHTNGNIAELLLKEGFARCVDWSMGVVSQGPEKLRAAEKVAKEKNLRIWKDYHPSRQTVDIKDKTFTAKVTEIVNGDAMLVKSADGSSRKIFLASIRPPRPAANTDEPKRDSRARARPLYEIPYMFEAREFLRKKLIGKKVNIQVDYIQPASESFPEKTCCTVTITGINVAEAMVSKGLATVIRYRQDDDQRSSQYDQLLAAESRANKKGVGLHSKKDNPSIRVADVSGDVSKAKQFLPFLQRAGRVEAIVEFVASGSRMRIYIPRETCLITFLLSGIECPRASRPGPGGVVIAAEPFGEEALQYVKDHTLQREVEVEVEAMDKGGNFIGWMFVEGNNVSVSLVEEGIAKVHFTAEKSNYFKAIQSAEDLAKSKSINLWTIQEETREEGKPENEPQERNINYRNVVVTEVTNDLQFYAQDVDNGPQLEKLMEQLRSEFSTKPPLPGSYTPKYGDICAAKFTDGEWYRAKIEKIDKNSVNVLYMDYGNRDKVTMGSLATLPSTFHLLPPQAVLFSLSCITVPADEEARLDAVDVLYNNILNRECQLNIEYKGTSSDFVTLLYADTRDDVVQSMLSEGLVTVDVRKEKRLQSLLSSYRKAQDKAKSERLNLWRYGDFLEDDAKEFGYQK